MGEKKKGKKKWIIIAAVAVIIIAAAAGGAGREGTTQDDKETVSSTAEKKDDAKKEETKKEEVKQEHYECDLTAGNYTAGKDIPVGTYNIEATAGSGNVSSSNMYSGGINEIMGAEVNGYNQQTFSGLKMEEGVVLSLSGDVVLHLTAENAEVQSMTGRSEAKGDPVGLSAGNYTAGTDFPAGVYNVTATGGSGNVSSSNMFEGGLNEIMGTDGYGITEYKNVLLEEGITLTVSGTTITLVPVGE